MYPTTVKWWHPALPPFNRFVIAFYFLFRKTNDFSQPRIAAGAYPAPYIVNGEHHAEYVQLFSWYVVASILNCFYIISAVKKRNRKGPSRAIFTRLWTLLSKKLCIKTVWIKGTVFEFLKHNCDPQFQAWNYFLLQNWWLNAKPCKFSTDLHSLPQRNDEKLTSLSPFFQPFCNCLLFFI